MTHALRLAQVRIHLLQDCGPCLRRDQITRGLSHLLNAGLQLLRCVAVFRPIAIQQPLVAALQTPQHLLCRYLQHSSLLFDAVVFKLG